jgi:hypothetical protein
MLAAMKAYVFKEPERGLAGWLVLFAGAAILVLSWPYLGWQWATGTPGILLGLGCMTLGAAELSPRNDVGRIIAGCIRVAGYLLFALMAIYVARAILA